jgi:hypothetical protein
MTRLSNLPCLLALAIGLGCLTSLAREYEGSRENSVVLNGAWEYAFGEGDEGAETAAGQRRLRWKQVTLPGPFMAWNQEVANQTKFVWAHRDFRVTPTQVESLAVLRWNRIACGADQRSEGRRERTNRPISSDRPNGRPQARRKPDRVEDPRRRRARRSGRRRNPYPQGRRPAVANLHRRCHRWRPSPPLRGSTARAPVRGVTGGTLNPLVDE